MTNWEKRLEEQRRLRAIAEAEEYVLTQQDIDEGFMPISDAAKTGEWVYARVVQWNATKEIHTNVLRYENGEFRGSLRHGGAVAWKPFPADLDPYTVDLRLRRDYEAARQARQKAVEQARDDERHALLPKDLPVLAAMAAGCRLHFDHEPGSGWGRCAWTICKLIHPDGREKTVSYSSVYRLQYWKLIDHCYGVIGGFSENNHDYALTAQGIARAETCTKSLEEIFKQRKAAKAAQPQETT
jgi:hypothetical protein